MARVRSERYERSRHGPDGTLHLKINVVTTEPLTAEEVRERLEEAVRTGRVPRGIRIHWIDWSKEMRAGQVRSGRIRQDVHTALRQFYGAIVAGDPRFEVVG